MTQIGPFFYIRGKLIYNACSLVEGREQAGKLDNPYGHDQLYDDHFKSGEYIDYPRGRVLWDEQKNRSIIYIDPCIHRDTVLSQIIEAFDIGNYIVEYDDRAAKNAAMFCYVPNMVRGRKYNIITKINVDYFGTGGFI